MLELETNLDRVDSTRLVAELSSLVAFYKVSLRHAQESLSQIYIRTYLCIQASTNGDTAGQLDGATKKLAVLLGESQKNVTAWYRYGDFMIRHDLPETSNSTSIRSLCSVAVTLDESALAFGLDLIKQNGRAVDVQALIKHHTTARAKTAGSLGDLDKKRFLAETKAYQIKAELFYRTSNLRIQVVDVNGRALNGAA